MLKDNLGTRLFALLLALLIWLQSVLVSDHRSVVSLPVNLKNIPQNITLENLPQKIPFIVKGKGLDIIRLMLAKPRVNIDAGNITPNTDIISLQNYSIDIPENVEVSLLGPSESDNLAIQADVFHQKTVSIELQYEDAYTKEKMNELRYSLNPDKVTIFGPKSKIVGISKVKTLPIDNKVFNDSRIELELDLPDSEINVSDTRVLLSISGEQESSRVFTNISLPEGYSPSRVAARISGPGSVLENMKIDSIKVEIISEPDEDGLFKVELVLPEGVKALAITPDRVRKRR
ncbi:MAG: CdaR family protein [Candidatus Cloacimonetes bacterium]|jgi:YbbR domain-containing protein|nr:hypothetical protein [Candidatus Cloacimonadota bacterium]MDY0298466.1 CdaR family protein [Candidatus Cloacimonadaceae bacterium]MCB5278836.1 hypothetical protein [Candidatus Cloacimonadota bacterium]MCK9332265.1 CdaR family protein [Candidatus Cloacimonadota bacterium]MDD2210125.1 CdaR family protein [Candidatus Cloacimonadota bacterium]